MLKVVELTAPPYDPNRDQIYNVNGVLYWQGNVISFSAVLLNPNEYVITDANGYLTTTAVIPGASTNLAVANRTATTLDVTSDTGTDATIPEASITEAGLLIASDKVKLNNTSGVNSGDQDLSALATTAYVDSKVIDSIADSDTDHAPSRNAVFDALALKAPLASPALTGNPTAPTQSAGDNSTKIATTAYVDGAVSAIVVPDASETVKGIAELATQTETNTGTDDSRIVTPLKLATWWTLIKTLDAVISGAWTFTKELILQDLTEPVTTTNKLYSVSGAIKWAGKYLAQIATTLGNSQVVETNGSGFLISAAKGTAYNKNFGTAAGDVCEGNDARLSDARAVAEVGESSITNNSSASVDLTVAATADRLYTYFTLPTTEKLYKITGIEWKNGTTVAGNTVCGMHLVDADPPSNQNLVLCGVGQSAANSGSGSVQRVSIVGANVFRGGTILGVFLQCDSTSHQYRSVTLGGTIANRKGVTFTFAPTTQDVTAWTNTTKGIYVKLYFYGY